MIVYKNITFHRGDRETVIIEYPGDISGHNLVFVVKQNRDVSSSRLIEIIKDNSSAETKFKAIYDSANQRTQLYVLPGAADTQDMYGSFVYDIYDYTDSLTVADGNLYLEPDVQTPFDGTNLPADGKRYIPYYPGNFNNNDVLQYNSSAGEFIGKQPDDLIKNDYYNKSEIDLSLSEKVDKITGKGLSTNDYTDNDKNRLVNTSGTNTGDQDLSPFATNNALTEHTGNTNNPHAVTKAQVGLGSVPNLDTTNSIDNLGGAGVLNQTLIEWATGESYQLTNSSFDSNGLVTTATAVWPDGSSGTFTTTSVNNNWLSIDAYSITHSLSNKTVTQATVTRDSNGNITTKPPLTVA